MRIELGIERLFAGTIRPGARAVISGPEGLLLADGSPAGFRQFARSPTGGINELRPLPGPARASSGLVNVGRFIYAVGGDDVVGDTIVASRSIERIDVQANAVQTAGALSQPVSGARPQVLRDRFIVVVGDGDLVEVFDTATEELIRVPPMAVARTQAGVARDRDGVLIFGGFDPVSDEREPLAAVERLEIVGSRQNPAPPPPVCVAAPLPLDQRVAGSTAGAGDKFRDELCAFPGNVGDQHWVIELTRPSGLEVIVERNDNFLIDFRVTVSAGLCEEGSPVLACGVGRVTVPTVPAGRWFISIESTAAPNSPRETEVLADGRAYTVQATAGPASECPADEADPADDVASGATLLPPTLSDAGDLPSATRMLCPGDVDHVLIGHVGPAAAEIDVTGIPPDAVRVARADLDDAASVAAGVPVVASLGAFGPPPDWSQEPPGFYVVQLGPTEGGIQLQWDLTQIFTCDPDRGDSLIEGFDDGVNLARATRLLSGDSVSVQQCDRSDRDVIVIEPDRAGPLLLLDISSYDSVVELFEIDGNALGAPLDIDVDVNEFGDAVVRVPERGPFAVRFSVAAGEETSDAQLTFSIPPAGDECASALPLPTTPGSLTHESRAFRDDVNAGDVGDCTGYRSPGEDVFYAVTLGPNQTLTATMTPAAEIETALYLLDACPAGDFADVCVVGEDDGGRGQPDTITFENGGAAADFFLVLDSFYGEPWSGTLTWTLQ